VHGDWPSALIDVKLNGSYLIAGKTIAGFADVEEDAADHATRMQVQPWRIEGAATERGATHVEGDSGRRTRCATGA
jgi:hypothetical protein